LDVLERGSLALEQEPILRRRLEEMLAHRPNAPPATIWITPETSLVEIPGVGECHIISEYQNGIIHLYPIFVETDEELARLLKVSIPEAQRFVITALRDGFGHASGLNQEQGDQHMLERLLEKKRNIQSDDHSSSPVEIVSSGNLYRLEEIKEQLEAFLEALVDPARCVYCGDQILKMRGQDSVNGSFPIRKIWLLQNNLMAEFFVASGILVSAIAFLSGDLLVNYLRSILEKEVLMEGTVSRLGLVTGLVMVGRIRSTFESRDRRVANSALHKQEERIIFSNSRGKIGSSLPLFLSILSVVSALGILLTQVPLNLYSWLGWLRLAQVGCCS